MTDPPDTATSATGRSLAPQRRAFHVYRHTGGPEDGVLEEDLLRSVEGFASVEEACAVTAGLFPDAHLVLLHGRHSGRIVAIRRPRAPRWSFLADGGV